MGAFEEAAKVLKGLSDGSVGVFLSYTPFNY